MAAFGVLRILSRSGQEARGGLRLLPDKTKQKQEGVMVRPCPDKKHACKTQGRAEKERSFESLTQQEPKEVRMRLVVFTIN